MRLFRITALLLGGLLLSAATWVAFRHGAERADTGLPVLGTVPEFSLIASDGQPLSSARLGGGAWVADFIFTQCPGLCPRLSAEMAKLQGELARRGSPVRMVSFTVDPRNDTPAALRAYAERFRADPERWVFVTGDRDGLYHLIHDGFHLAIAERSAGENTDGEGLITHSDRFVLVDQHLQIRGYYHGTDPDAVHQLLQDIDTLHKPA